MKALVELALAINEEERSSEGVSEVVAKALKKHKEASEEAATTDIVDLLRKIEEHKQTRRIEIRAAKAKLKTLTSELKDLDRRWAFAQKKNNFLPVLKFFNLLTPGVIPVGEVEALTTVPSDFKVE